MTNSIVKFENQDIELITVDGQPMMTAAQIGAALGGTDGQNVRPSDRQNVGACDVAKIYRRNADSLLKKNNLTRDSLGRYVVFEA